MHPTEMRPQITMSENNSLESKLLLLTLARINPATMMRGTIDMRTSAALTVTLIEKRFAEGIVVLLLGEMFQFGPMFQLLPTLQLP